MKPRKLFDSREGDPNGPGEIVTVAGYCFDASFNRHPKRFGLQSAEIDALEARYQHDLKAVEREAKIEPLMWVLDRLAPCGDLVAPIRADIEDRLAELRENEE